MNFPEGGNGAMAGGMGWRRVNAVHVCRSSRGDEADLDHAPSGLQSPRNGHTITSWLRMSAQFK